LKFENDPRALSLPSSKPIAEKVLNFSQGEGFISIESMQSNGGSDGMPSNSGVSNIRVGNNATNSDVFYPI
jgi:hypothetical protein